MGETFSPTRCINSCSHGSLHCVKVRTLSGVQTSKQPGISPKQLLAILNQHSLWKQCNLSPVFWQEMTRENVKLRIYSFVYIHLSELESTRKYKKKWLSFMKIKMSQEGKKARKCAVDTQDCFIVAPGETCVTHFLFHSSSKTSEFTVHTHRHKQREEKGKLSLFIKEPGVNMVLCLWWSRDVVHCG